jgi:predicted permease
MSGWSIVLLKIVAMFLVILVGWVARRKAYLTGETTSTLSRFVVDITIPALVFTQMLRTVNVDELRTQWSLPLLGAAVILIGQAVGLFSMPLFSRKDQRSTFIFLVAVGNWIYLPLPIVEALYGASGVSAVLLFNVGAQMVLWTIGVWTLRGGKPDLASLRELAKNSGLIATAVGIVLALLIPAMRVLEKVTPDNVAQLVPGIPAALVLGVSTLVAALVLVGSLTIPLSLIVTGAQLGGLDLSDHRPSTTLTGVIVARLFMAPVVTVALVTLLAHLHIRITDTPRMVGYIIAAMPVAVSCSIFTERFGGDTSLASRAIFYSTLLSIATVPIVFAVIQHFGL